MQVASSRIEGFFTESCLCDSVNQRSPFEVIRQGIVPSVQAGLVILGARMRRATGSAFSVRSPRCHQPMPHREREDRSTLRTPSPDYLSRGSSRTSARSPSPTRAPGWTTLSMSAGIPASWVAGAESSERVWWGPQLDGNCGHGLWRRFIAACGGSVLAACVDSAGKQ